MKKAIIIILAAFLLSMCGCQAKDAVRREEAGVTRARALDAERAYKHDRTYYVDERDGLIEDALLEAQSGAAPEHDKGDRTRALRDRIAAMPGVIDAAVIINGQTALVGVSTHEGPESAAVSEIKKRIRELAHLYDRDVSRVAVTAESELYRRIVNITKTH